MSEIFLTLNNSSKGGRFFRYKSKHFTISDICDHLIDGGDIVLKEKEYERDLLLSCVKLRESKNGNIDFLNRVIINGGFINYIKKLETLKQER